MPIPACELTRAPFTAVGAGAPRVLPCGHIYSLRGLQQVRRSNIACCSSAQLSRMRGGWLSH
jgi:hypothetical protein